MSRLTARFADYWQPVLYGLAGLIGCLSIYTVRIASLVPGASLRETSWLETIKSLRSILRNPVYLPFALPQHILYRLDFRSVSITRLVAAIFGLLSVMLFFYIMSQWHSTRVAILTSLVFAMSAWMLHVSRQATPQIMLVFMPLAILASGVYIRRSFSSTKSLLIGVVVVACSFYVPIVCIGSLAIIIWRSRAFLASKYHPKLSVQLAITTLFVVLIAPLTYALFRHPSVMSELIGYNGQKISLHILKTSVVQLITATFYRANGLGADMWIAGIPILDVASIALAFLGVYSYFTRRVLDRTAFMVVFLVLGSLCVAYSGQIEFVGVIIPIIYLLVASGITLLISNWRVVFPKNAFAQTFGSILMSILCLSIVFYNINHYFVTWPLVPETKSAFSMPLVLK